MPRILADEISTTVRATSPREPTRAVGVWGATAVNIANMIGTGIFLKTRVMTCNVGSPGMVLAVWLAAGLLSLAGTFAYSEIAAMMPEAGGDYVFLRRAYGRGVGFLYGWTTVTVARSGGQAAIAAGLAIFANVALGGALARWHLDLQVGGHTFILSGLVAFAIATLWAVAFMACASVATGGHTALIITIIKAALLLGIGIAAFWLAPGSWEHLRSAGATGSCEGVSESARGGLVGFGAAMLGALWAYDGWNNVAPLAGEVRNPQKNLPKAFVGGVLTVAALYLWVNVAFFYTLSPTEVASVPANSSVATEVVKRFMGGGAATLMAIALIVSSFGALHANVLANSRIPFAMARDGMFFATLSQLSPRSNVPVRAILAQSAWCSLLLLAGSYDSLTDSVIFASWLFYGLSVSTVFVYRRTLPDVYRPYRALGYPVVPMIFLVLATALLINALVAAPLQAVRGIGLLLAGLPLYWYWSRRAPANG
jgi:APA family basic amino acid/polyamine antiporter